MTRALFKKQLMELFSWIYQDRRSGKARSKASLIGYVFLYVFLFGYLGVMFFNVAKSLCTPLAEVGLGWLYMALMSIIGVALGVFGSIFNTYSSLYCAKDNDLLLSMPIPTRKVLFIRLSGVYVMGLMYELIIMIPTLIVYYMNVKISPLGVIYSLLIPFVLSFLVLTLSCVLGWVVALVNSKLKNTKIVTVFLMLGFIVLYYYVYLKAYSALMSIIANPLAMGDKVKSILYPFYHMGLAAEGKTLSMLIFTSIFAALFAIVYLILERSFLKLATTNKGAKKAKYRERAAHSSSVGTALLYKEWRRFLGSPTYMLNCALGTPIMVVVAVLLIVKSADIRSLLLTLISGFSGVGALVPLIAVAAICIITSMNDLTAPSVSLEGKNLWLVKSYPVSASSVLMAKLKLHLLLTLIPTLILTTAAVFVIRPSWISAILMYVSTSLFVTFMALVGLVLGLKMPNLNWKDETVPVKQSMPVMLTLFGGWVAVVSLGAIFFALSRWISPTVYLLLATALLGVLSAILLVWTRTKGAKIFEKL